MGFFPPYVILEIYAKILRDENFKKSFLQIKGLKVLFCTSLSGTSLPSLINLKDGGKPSLSAYKYNLLQTCSSHLFFSTTLKQFSFQEKRQRGKLTSLGWLQNCKWWSLHESRHSNLVCALTLCSTISITQSCIYA